jgi:hypothetical protein
MSGRAWSGPGELSVPGRTRGTKSGGAKPRSKQAAPRSMDGWPPKVPMLKAVEGLRAGAAEQYGPAFH